MIKKDLIIIVIFLIICIVLSSNINASVAKEYENFEEINETRNVSYIINSNCFITGRITRTAIFPLLFLLTNGMPAWFTNFYSSVLGIRPLFGMYIYSDISIGESYRWDGTGPITGGDGWIKVKGDNGEQEVSSDNFIGKFYNFTIDWIDVYVTYNIGIKGFRGFSTILLDPSGDCPIVFIGHAREVKISYYL